TLSLDLSEPLGEPLLLALLRVQPLLVLGELRLGLAKLGTVLGRLPAQLGDLPAGPLRVRPRVVLLLVLRLVPRGLHRLCEPVLRLRVVGRVILRRLRPGGCRDR